MSGTAAELSSTVAATADNPAAGSFAGASSQYVLADSNGAAYVQDVISGRDGTQTLTSTSVLHFADASALFDPTGAAGEITRLYLAAFGHLPDLAGLQYWQQQADDGASLATIAGAFTGTPEFVAGTGTLGDADYVSQVYANALGRAPDSAGLQQWVGALGSGVTRAEVLTSVAESPEAARREIGVADDAGYGEAYRLYQAAFDRAPDTTGLAYWQTLLDGSTTPLQVAAAFTTSPEFTSDFGGLDPSGFVTQLYANVLHRAPDASGLQFWTGQIATGASEASVLLGFSDSLENRVATAGMTHDSYVLLPN